MRTLLIILAVCVAPDLARAQTCFEHLRSFNYSPGNCESIESIDRVFRLQEIHWKGHDYLFVDEGNELKIFNLDDPHDPLGRARSYFNVPNLGDSDYDLLNFSVCDDCRFGIANFKSATVLFDLGTGDVPRFEGVTRNSSATQVKGGFTFQYGGQQYLVAASLGDACDGNKSGLYEFNGIDEAGNSRIQCLEGAGSFSPQIANGLLVDSVDPPVIYMAERFYQFRIYRVAAGTPLQLDYLGNGGIERADMNRTGGVSVDETVGLMAVAYGGTLTLHDIGFSSGAPTSPRLLKTLDLPSPLENANAVALSYPIVHVAQRSATATPATFDVSNPTSPVPLDSGFWDPSQSWNDVGDCVWNNHALFSSDGSALVLSRYSVLQVVDPTDCAAGGALPTDGGPIAGDPTTAFVGDPTAGDPTPGDPTPADPTAGDPTPGDPAAGDPAAGDPMEGDPMGEDVDSRLSVGATNERPAIQPDLTLEGGCRAIGPRWAAILALAVLALARRRSAG